MNKVLKYALGGAIVLLPAYFYVFVPLQEYYSTPGITVPAAIPENMQEEEAVQVIETEALILEAINSFEVEAQRFEIKVRDSRNNWDSLKFEWWESEAGWKYLWGRSISSEGLGYVTASFDLKVRRSDITRDGDVFVINVGAPKISNVVLPQKNVKHTAKSYQGDWVSADGILRLKHNSELQLEQNLLEEACSKKIFTRAKENFKVAFLNFLRLATSDSIRFRIETREGECIA